MQLRRRKKKKGCCLTKLISLLVVFVVLIYGWSVLSSLLPIGTGYAAKYLCSCSTLTDRANEDIIANDLEFSLLKYAQSGPSKRNGAVSSFAGLFAQNAEVDLDNGCVLQFHDFEEVDVQLPKYNLQNQDSIAWPLGNQIDVAHFNDSIQLLVNEAVNGAMGISENTRALVVLKDGKIVAEQYAANFNQDTRLLGWSMAKSITGILTGIFVKQEKLSIQADHLFESWNNDSRQNITLDQLLRMSSGLEWVEKSKNYYSKADATTMFYNRPNMTEYALTKKAEFEPDTYWEYSSGTTNLITGLMRQTLEDDLAYWSFPYAELFNKLGMQSAVMETDAAGNFVGSSYCWATARDWARFGQFLLNDGEWNGEQLIPENWIDYMSTPTPHTKQGEFGAHLWLNEGLDGNGTNRKFANCPTDLIYCGGFKGQYVIVVPSEELVIVRLGHSDPGVFDVNKFVSEVIHSFD